MRLLTTAVCDSDSECATGYCYNSICRTNVYGLTANAHCSPSYSSCAVSSLIFPLGSLFSYSHLADQGYSPCAAPAGSDPLNTALLVCQPLGFVFVVFLLPVSTFRPLMHVFTDWKERTAQHLLTVRILSNVEEDFVVSKSVSTHFLLNHTSINQIMLFVLRNQFESYVLPYFKL